ncbi:MAG: 5'/3'-nucleotidase SurE [Clostridia bacterium]|nr:5'/3'-nucleotidase SurE [Clostridia bacterium]
MHILLTNDDGIFAPGILALKDAAIARGHKVSICAPNEERSAASHSITLRRNMKVKREEIAGVEFAYAVDGQPADCARLGLWLVKDVDIVIAGINNGPNMGGACIYSGTVAAATEASMSGTPALAASFCGFNTHEYAASAIVTVKVAEWMIDHPLPRGAIYNLNVPALPLDELRGIRAADLGASYLDDPYYREIPGEEGTEYTYGHGVDSVKDAPENCDVTLTQKGYATLTKLSWNLQLNAPAPDVSGIVL